MKMIAHETPGMQLPIGLCANFGEGSQKALAICIILEDRLTAITAIHHVVDGTGVLNSELARYSVTLVAHFGLSTPIY
jgi:hypothetical protein